MKQIQLIAACLFIQLCFTTRFSSSHPLNPLGFLTGGSSSLSSNVGETAGRALGSLFSLPLAVTKETGNFLTSSLAGSQKRLSDTQKQLPDASLNVSAKGLQRKDSGLLGSTVLAPLEFLANTIDGGANFGIGLFYSILRDAENAMNEWGQFSKRALEKFVVPMLKETSVDESELIQILEFIAQLQSNGVAYGEALLKTLEEMKIEEGVNVNV